MSETIDLKSLATKALERLDRNKVRNRIGTNDENLVPRTVDSGTGNNEDYLAILDLQYDYEERLAICEYDGALDFHEAFGVAASDYFELNKCVYE